MQSSTGRWVSGDNFFNRDKELQILETRVRDGNHVLLTGQRRMGKTSMTQELGRRLAAQGWEFLFTDVEGATCAEDVISAIAEAAHPVRPISSRIGGAVWRWFQEKVEELRASEFRVKFRATQNVFTADARRCLERAYEKLVEDVPACVTETLDVLVHDGYLEPAADGHRFPSRLLKDWWSARFRDHHVPLEQRPSARPLGVS